MKIIYLIGKSSVGKDTMYYTQQDQSEQEKKTEYTITF